MERQVAGQIHSGVTRPDLGNGFFLLPMHSATCSLAARGGRGWGWGGGQEG